MKNYKYLGLGLTVLASALGATAAPISPEEALRRAQASGNVMVPLEGTRAIAMPQLKMTLDTPDGEAALYVFENVANDGFMVVSADDAAIPLLGYSDKGTIDPANLPPALEYWLGEYARQIEYARANGATTRNGLANYSITLPDWEPIKPMLKTIWNQDAPFNNKCPQISYNGKTYQGYTGCVATAMSQVMNYYQYPAKGKGSINYTTQTLQMPLSLNFSTITFDWDNMLDSYLGNYTAAQGNAVATLMQAAGYGVEMDYVPGSSGAASGLIPYALINYFSYDPGVIYTTRDMYTYTEWATKIYNNLKEVGPLIYDGSGEAGGHSFVCDGYDKDGYFHFNWGWSGLSDGYYLLDAMDPPALGIGGGGGGFIFNQDAIFNIRKPVSGSTTPEQSELVLAGSLTGVIAGNNLTFVPTGAASPGWEYQGTGTLNFYMGIGYVNADTPDAGYQFQAQYSGSSPKRYSLTGQYYVRADAGVGVDLTRVNLTPGTKYKIVSAYQDLSNQQWNVVEAGVGNSNYLYLTKGTDGKYTVENIPQLMLQGVSMTLDSELYFNSAAKFQVTVSNPNNTELTRGLTPVVVSTATSARVHFVGESFLVSLPAGGSQTYDFITSLSKSSTAPNITKDTEYYLGLMDPDTEKLFYKTDETVVMHPLPGELQLSSSVSVVGATQMSNGAYRVKNASAFQTESTLKVISGYFADQVTLGLYTPDGTGTADLTTTYPLGGYEFMNAGSEKTWITDISFPTAVIGDTYYLGLRDSSGLIEQYLSVQILIQGNNPSVSVETITTNEGEILFLYDQAGKSLNVVGGENGIASVEAYYLNGMRAPIEVTPNGDNAFVKLSGLGKGVIVVTATDYAGNRKSTKIML
ncbi:MAG: C10 family peptidase [Muribaculaceae bacterium]|nr:C10 family peptidase [Muribaculaceae bacterium]